MNWLAVNALAEGTAEEVKSSWPEMAVSKFTETPLEAWIAFGVVLVLGLVLLAAAKSSGNRETKVRAYGLLAISLSFVLSCICLYKMPDGGSVTAASMLPLLLFSAMYGVGPGFLAGFIYGVLQALQGGITGLSAGMILLDFLLPFAAVGLAGLAKELPESWGLYPSIVAAALARILFHTMSGVQFYEYGTLASFEYNITYLGPDTLICIVLAFIIAKPVMRMMRRQEECGR